MGSCGESTSSADGDKLAKLGEGGGSDGGVGGRGGGGGVARGSYFIAAGSWDWQEGERRGKWKGEEYKYENQDAK